MVLDSNYFGAVGQAANINFEWLAFYGTTKAWAAVGSSLKGAVVTVVLQVTEVVNSSSINSRKRPGHIH